MANFIPLEDGQNFYVDENGQSHAGILDQSHGSMVRNAMLNNLTIRNKSHLKTG